MLRTFALLACVVALASGALHAENVDPDNDGSQYAWAENVGWLNAEPQGNGGPGMVVTDFELRGWLWGENVGWISLSCKNTASCGSGSYGVSNDGAGSLTGYGWAENVGWLSFSCENTASCAGATYGVSIDPATGDFSGRAWAENVGWVTFASSGANPYKVKTSWNCVPPPVPPSGIPRLTLSKSDAAGTLNWTGVLGATGFDVVAGSLAVLRSSGGDFTAATAACVGPTVVGKSLALPNAPAIDSGVWFLVRAVNCGGKGTYDSGGAGQSGLRDLEIAASGHDCP